MSSAVARLVALAVLFAVPAPVRAFRPPPPAAPIDVEQARSEGNEDRAAVVVAFRGSPEVRLRSTPATRWVMLEFPGAQLAAGAQVLSAWAGLVEAASLEQASDRLLRVAVQVARGTRVSVYRGPSASGSSFTVLVQRDDDGALLPVRGRLSSRYGWRMHPILHEVRMHQGIDIAVPTGTSIRAVRAGEVLRAGYQGDAGLCVVIRHADGVEAKYMHCSKLLVHAGERVKRRQVLAASGETGLTTGPHVHFAVSANGKPIDPVRYLRSAERAP